MGALQIGSDCDARTSVSQRVQPETMKTYKITRCFAVNVFAPASIAAAIIG